MEKIAVSKFKATCLAILERVRKTGESYVITKRGVPIAQVVPPPLLTAINKSAFGCLAEMGEELRNIVEPITDVKWEATR